MAADTEINKEGYLVFKDSKKPVHRWVAKQKYGDETDGKEVHHIDGNKLNNNKENLILLSKEDHFYLTQYNNKKNFITDILIWLILFYLILINLLMYTKILNQEVSLVFARTSVFIALIVAVELRYGFVEKWIRKKR